MAVDPGNGGAPFMTVREAVLEIRDDVKDLMKKVDRIDRDGSIGTKQELDDHEHRIRSLEKSDSRLSGAWSAILIAFSTVVGVAGLAFGLLAYLAA